MNTPLTLIIPNFEHAVKQVEVDIDPLLAIPSSQWEVRPFQTAFDENHPFNAHHPLF